MSVGYADVCNCALLVEIARRKGHYVPELSFGTHFFQGLVESNIRYLPLHRTSRGDVPRAEVGHTRETDGAGPRRPPGPG